MDTLQQALTEARRRHADKANYQSTRNLTESPHEVGMYGEEEFSRVSGLPMDLTDRREGDGGRDFTIHLESGSYGLNVKTAQHSPPWLMCECKKLHEDFIYVLAHKRGHFAHLIGWEWGRVLGQSEPGDYARTGMVNYRLVPEQLRPIKDLLLQQIWSWRVS